MHEFRQVRMGRFLVRRKGYHMQPEWTVAHWCPACDETHDFAVDGSFHNGAKWTFNGDEERPAFSPSMNIVTGPMRDGKKLVCHYFVTFHPGPPHNDVQSMIEYTGDCTHSMAGQRVPLPEIPVERVGRNTKIEER